MPTGGSSSELIQPPFPLPAPLELRRSARARRISLRIDLARNRIVLVAPRATARRHVLDFIHRHENWLRTHLARLPAPSPFIDGATLPILGTPHLIHGDPRRMRGIVDRADGIVMVPGAPEHLSRRLTDYLKAEATRELGARARGKAATIGRPVAAVAIRDTRSRWGSCGSAGRISFSWRLIMAPDWVLDYVVAHEVAHLVEMNHGPRFWAFCAQLTQSEPAAARAWLRRHGPELHAFG